VTRTTPLALLATIALAAPAAAEPCDSLQPEAGVPVRAPIAAADLGMLPEACPSTSIEARGRLRPLIDEDDFYGNLHAGGALRGRLELPDGVWLSAHFPGVDYRFVANATVEAESIDLSASTLAAHLALPIDDDVQLAPYLRVMLPTETVLQHAHRWGFEHGIAAVVRFHQRLEMVGGYALPVLLTSQQARTEVTYTPTFSADLHFRPWRWLSLVGGLAVRISVGEAEVLESYDPRAALRLYPWRGAFIDLAGAFPLLGRDRSIAAVGGTLGWLFDAPGWAR
jgi:hypothetical protein